MPKHNKEKPINFISENSISAIISKFEEKRFPIRQPKTDIHSKLKMGDTKILQGNEVFKDVNRSNGNRNILLENSNLKTFKNSEIQSRGRSLLNLFSWFVFLLSSVNGAIATTLTLTFLLPRALIKSLFYPGYRLLFGTLYPAYASYKAVRTKNVKEYVKWMMYWIVFALFSCTETFTDIFLSWFPLYYEIKVIIVIWLLSPATKGSSILYRKFVHPMLTKREQEIDEYISQAKEKGYSAVLQYGSRGVNYATSVIMQTALKTIDNIVLNKPAQKPLINANDVPDGPDRMLVENAELFSSVELNQFEISSDDDGDLTQSAARSRPVRKRKCKVDSKPKGRGRKQRTDEADEVIIE